MTTGSIASIAAWITTRRVQVLWMGMNPKVPQSLAQVLSPPLGDGDYPTFEWQCNSGYYASWKWHQGVPERDWNPIGQERE